MRAFVDAPRSRRGVHPTSWSPTREPAGLLPLGLILFFLAPLLLGCSSKPAFRSGPRGVVGYGTYYGPGFHGKPTASGELFDQYALTAAHRTLPFGTRVKVTNLANGKSVVVRINDRGPFVPGVIIDLSYEAARRIGLLSKGMVRLEVLD